MRLRRPKNRIVKSFEPISIEFSLNRPEGREKIGGVEKNRFTKTKNTELRVENAQKDNCF